MSIKGPFASDMSVPGDRKLQGFPRALIELEAVNMAPLIAMAGGQTTRGFRQTSVEWTEKQNQPSWEFIVGNHGNPNGCTFQVADSSAITENSIYLIPSTGEYIFITGVTGNTITVKRDFGNTRNQAPIVPTASAHIMLLNVGNAFNEGSERPAAVSTLPGVPRVNYTQIFRHTWAITRTAKMVEYNLGDMKPRLKKDCMMRHMEAIERAILLGVKTNGHLNGQPFRTFDGIFRSITTNIAAPADGVLTEDMLNTFLEVIFSNNIAGTPNERIALVGRSAITMINRLVRGSTQYSINENTTSFGLDISSWKTPHGKITLIPHEMLTNLPGHHSDILILHPKSLHIYHMYEGMEDSDRKEYTNGIDGDIGGLTSELTMAFKGELTAGLFTGICDVAPTPQAMQIVQPHKAAVHPVNC
jgi:Family of unknown function (DUF5309)